MTTVRDLIALLQALPAPFQDHMVQLEIFEQTADDLDVHVTSRQDWVVVQQGSNAAYAYPRGRSRRTSVWAAV